MTPMTRASLVVFAGLLTAVGTAAAQTKVIEGESQTVTATVEAVDQGLAP